MADVEKNPHLLNWINVLQIQVMDSGRANMGKNWHRENVRSPYSRLYYVLDGEGWATHDEVRQVYLPGHMYLIPIGYQHNYGCEENMDHLYFHINITMPSGYDLFSQCNQIYELPMTEAEREEMLALYQREDMGGALALTSCLYRDVTRFIAQANMAAKPAYAYSEMIQRIFPLVREHLTAHLTIAQLAETMSVSPSTLTKRFRAEIEMPLGRYIDHMLFQRAQQLLLFTTMSIGEISDQLEFCDQFYFSRYFKQHQNETPSHYRRRMKGGS